MFTDPKADVLVIEDVRDFRFPCVYARTLKEGWDLIFSRPWREVWLDHDLSLNMEEWESPEGTIMPLVNELERLGHEGTILPIGIIFVHTANPYGGVQMMAALSKYYFTRRVAANDYIASGSVVLHWTGPTDIVDPTKDQMKDMLRVMMTADPPATSK